MSLRVKSFIMHNDKGGSNIQQRTVSYDFQIFGIFAVRACEGDGDLLFTRYSV